MRVRAWTAVLAMVGTVALAEPPAAVDAANTAPPVSVPQKAETKAPALPRASLLGVDADNDGVRDDIEAIVAKEGSPMAPKPAMPAAVDAEMLPEGLMPKQKVRRETPRRKCFDYIMLSPEDKQRADLHMRQRTNNLPGTHPCDPVMSPLRERPFETDFVEIDLGPIVYRANGHE